MIPVSHKQAAMRLGYVGLGAMGGAMARNLVNAGHDVTVYDLDQAKVEELAASGATAATSAEDLARNVDVLFTSLPGPRQAASAMPSLIDALGRGAIWVHTTTNDERAQEQRRRQLRRSP